MILIYNTYTMNFKTNISKAKSLDAISGLELISMSVHHYRDRIICIIVFVMKHLLSGAFFMPLGFCHLPRRHKGTKLISLATLRLCAKIAFQHVLCQISRKDAKPQSLFLCVVVPWRPKNNNNK